MRDCAEPFDHSATHPTPRPAGPGDERGRGLAIITALADDSGVRTEPDGKPAGSPSARTLAASYRAMATTYREREQALGALMADRAEWERVTADAAEPNCAADTPARSSNPCDQPNQHPHRKPRTTN